jgi:energy-coupling factor transporter ATP-binding protein EcfA2
MALDMLEQRGLTQCFRRVTAMNQVWLVIPDGQMVGIIGLSGAGRSTPLRMIDRLRDPSACRILLDLRDASDPAPLDVRGMSSNGRSAATFRPRTISGSPPRSVKAGALRLPAVIPPKRFGSNAVKPGDVMTGSWLMPTMLRAPVPSSPGRHCGHRRRRAAMQRRGRDIRTMIDFRLWRSSKGGNEACAPVGIAAATVATLAGEAVRQPPGTSVRKWRESPSLTPRTACGTSRAACRSLLFKPVEARA